MKPALNQTIRVRVMAYRHQIVRLWAGDGGDEWADVEQRGGRNHGARRTVPRHRVRG